MKKQLWSIAVLLVATSAAADGVKISGYAAGAAWWDNSGAGVKPGSYFDGAVYLSKELDGGSFLLDIPVQMSGVNSSLTLATNKAQGYVQHKYKSGSGWRLGQWDSAFGVDANDANANVFAGSGGSGGGKGLIYNAVPVTHAGLAYLHDLSAGLALTVFVAAANNATAIPNGANADYGLHFNWKADKTKVNFGFLMNKAAVGETMLFDLNGSFGLGGDLNLDLGALVRKPNVGNSGFGALAQLSTKLGDDVTGAIRGEFGSKLNATQDTAFNAAIGPQFAMTKELYVKPEYWLTTSKVLSTSPTTTAHTIYLAAAYVF